MRRDHVTVFTSHSDATGWHTHIGRAWETVNALKIHYMNMFDNYLSPRLHEKPLSKLLLQIGGGESPFSPKPLGTKTFDTLVYIVLV